MILLEDDAEFEHADIDAAVVFVDMAGFTAFTEVHGDHRAARLAEMFAATVEATLGSADATVKTIGDGVLVLCETATAAVDFLRRLTVAIGRIPGFPLVRAGVAAGRVVRRRGDVFGSTVNTAARGEARLGRAGRSDRRQRARRVDPSGSRSRGGDRVGATETTQRRLAR